MKKRIALGIIVCALLASAEAKALTERLNLPPGFKIEIFAQVKGARSLARADALGVVFVSTRGPYVYAVDIRTRAVTRVLSDLKVANGIAYRDGYLYVAEQHRLTRYRATSLDDLEGQQPEVLFDRLPDKRHHGWRYIAFGPTGMLYMGVGAPCNVCLPQGLEGSITAFAPPGYDTPAIVASGVRNTVGIDVHPATGQVHFTDNGADMMGDDKPSEELNALVPGAHYGYPWYGGGHDRTSFDEAPVPESLTFPIATFQAHVAPLGVDFYEGDMFPEDYQHDAFIAQHGSWNRSSRVGYQVVRVRFDAQGKAVGAEPFISGWLRPNQSVLGRPVDVEDLPDGSLLISDDGAGLVYRVTYTKP